MTDIDTTAIAAAMIAEMLRIDEDRKVQAPNRVDRPKPKAPEPEPKSHYPANLLPNDFGIQEEDTCPSSTR